MVVPVVDHTTDGRFNGTAGSLDSYIEGSRLFYVTVASHFEHFISMWRPNCSLVVDDQLQMMAFTVYTAGVLVVGFPGVCIHGVPRVLGRH